MRCAARCIRTMYAAHFLIILSCVSGKLAFDYNFYKDRSCGFMIYASLVLPSCFAFDFIHIGEDFLLFAHVDDSWL